MKTLIAEKLIKSAIISEDGLYRYQLKRKWSDGPRITFIMLNPSTADARVDDPTIRRCIGFAKSLGGGELCVVNLYAYRSTRPGKLWQAEDPVGKDNDRYLAEATKRSALVIAAWGSNAHSDRVQDVVSLVGAEKLTSLGTTKDGSPRHPLYVRSDVIATPWKMLVEEKV